jgi:hypothetical protein
MWDKPISKDSNTNMLDEINCKQKSLYQINCNDILYAHFICANELINLIKLHYLLFELHSVQPKFDV